MAVGYFVSFMFYLVSLSETKTLVKIIVETADLMNRKCIYVGAFYE